jgi:hypothetical protein
VSCLSPDNVPLVMSSLRTKPYLLALLDLMDKTTDRDKGSEEIDRTKHMVQDTFVMIWL